MCAAKQQTYLGRFNGYELEQTSHIANVVWPF